MAVCDGCVWYRGQSETARWLCVVAVCGAEGRVRLCDGCVWWLCVVQRAELAALRAKRQEEEQLRRAQAKQDKLYVSLCVLLLECIIYWSCNCTVLSPGPLSTVVLCMSLWAGH